MREMDIIGQRWNAIVNAMVAAGIPADEVSVLAVVLGAHILTERGARSAIVRRPIGFVPPTKES